MWALVTFVIGQKIDEHVVSVQTKHIKYNRTGVMFIGGYYVYKNWIVMLKQNMGIRPKSCGNCWAYMLMILRVFSAVCTFFFLFPRLCIIYSRSFEVYDENAYIYGVLEGHDHWYTAILSWIIFILAVMSLLVMVAMFILYFVFLRIYGMKVFKKHFVTFEKYLMRSAMEFIIGTSRRIKVEVSNY
jgi:hypothetical protein